MARSRRVRVRRQKAWARALSGIMSALIALEPVAIHAQSLPVVPVSPGTTLDRAQNGVPIVNVATPNGRGVSHNQFDRFDVGAPGLILNNGTKAGVSVLGGAIAANANLHGKSARLILNEVTGAARSTLEGATEIFGGRAEYILANPNGITCNGCGFINTPKATLATGAPVWNADGSLAGLTVSGGDIAVGARGLDARGADAFDLVARTVSLAGPLTGNDVAVIAGRNAYDPHTRQAAALADDGSDAPLFAIDSSALGGMYAGRIALIGTEAGVGVRMDGELATSTAGLTLSADGRIEVRKASAAGDLAVTTGDALAVGESLTAAGNAAISADTLDLAAGTQLGAVGDLTLGVRTAAVDGTLAAGMTGGGGALSASAAETLTVSGTVSARGDLSLSADALEVSGQAASGAHATLSGRAVGVSGTVLGDRVTLSPTEDATVSGAIEAATTAEIAAGRDATVAATGAVSARSVTIGATRDATVAGRATATADLALTADGAAAVASGGRAQAGGALVASGATVSNAGTLQSAGDLTIRAAQAFANADLVFAGASLAVEAESVANSGGTLLAADDIAMTATGEILNAAGAIETANGDIRLTGASVRNVGSKTAADVVDELIVDEYYPMQSGTPRPPCGGGGGCKSKYWKKSAAVPDPRPGHTGTSYYGTSKSGSVTSRIYEQRLVSTAGVDAQISAGRDLAIDAPDIANVTGTVSAVRDITMTGKTLANQGLMGTGRWQISVKNKKTTRCYGDSLCAGFSNGGGTATLDSWSIELSPAIIQAGGSITGSFTDRVDNTSIRAGDAQPAGAYKALIGEIKDTSLVWGDPGTLPQSRAALDARLGATIPGFKSLFTTANATSSYVYESRVAYTDLGTFYGSDYFFSRAGLSAVDYEALPKRLGDAYFDTQYIRDRIIAETGSRWLDPKVANDAAQLKALIDNGVAVAGDLDLSVGVALTAEQIAALDRDIVWYETEEVDGQEVLVPHLYLADATRAAITPTGAVIAAAGNIDLDALTVVNAEGRVAAGGALTVAASKDIVDLSGKLVSGGDMTLAAGGDVTIATQSTVFADGRRNARDVRVGEAGVNAGDNLAVTAGGDLAVTGAKVAAGGDATFDAKGDVALQALAQSRHEEEGNRKEGYRLDALDHHLTTVEVGGSTTVKAGDDLSLVGAKVASGGETKLEAEGDVTIAAVTDTYSLESWKKKKSFGRKSSTKGQIDSATVRRSEVSSGADLSADAGKNIEVSASTLTAEGDLALTAEGSVGLSAQADRFHEEVHKKTSGLQKGKMDGTEAVVTHQVTELSSGGDLAVTAKSGDVALEATRVASAGSATISAEDGLVGMLSVTDSDFKSVSKTGSNLVWQSAAGKGHDDTTVRMVTIDAGGGLTVTAGDGVVVEYKGGKANLAETVDRLSQEPGLAWLKEMQSRDDVAWNAVAEAHKSWDYKSQGLSGPAAAVISIAIAIATQGWGAGAAGSLAGGGGALTGVGGAMANAAMTSLITQASLSLINNQGNLGAVFQDLGSSSALKSLATAVVTAGLTQRLLGGASPSADTKALSLMDRVQKAATQQLAKAAINTATEVVINGAPLDDVLRSRILAAAGGVIGEIGANKIGDLAADGKISEAVQYVAHAALGCGLGSMSGADCASGATGAVVGELAAGIYTTIEKDSFDVADTMEKIETWKQAGVDISKLSGALAAFFAGLDVETAANSAENAAKYNKMAHIARGINTLFIEKIASHRATVIERNSPQDFSEEIRSQLGEPILLSNGQYGYILEHTKQDGDLRVEVNSSEEGGTVDRYRRGDFSTFGRLDDVRLEDALLTAYVQDKALSEPYPSNLATILCFANVCNSRFSNSNTKADAMLAAANIPIPNTGNASVPGGVYDRENYTQGAVAGIMMGSHSAAWALMKMLDIYVDLTE